jgi:two-component system cell cycle sensor histidine kinase/response regulator CckA
VPKAPPVVLVVDDEDTICQIVSRFLKDEGIVCITAHTGEAALQGLRTNPWPDLFIVDVRLPGMSGPDFVAEAQRIRQDTSVLYISGYPEPMLQGSYSLGDTSAFLPKPFGYEQLIAAVRRLLISAAPSSKTL